MNERVMPHSLEAERSVLGAVMLDNEAYPVASAILTAAMFYRDAHIRLWKRMGKLSDANEPIDLVTINEALIKSGEVEEVGGMVYVSRLIDGVPKATNVEYYAKIVRQKYELRKLVKGASKILESAYSAGAEADAVIDDAGRIVMDIGSSSVATEFVLADDWANELAAQIEYATTHKRLITGVPTGIPTLDRYTRGLQANDMIFIGARPSVGKTALMLQMALHASDHAMTGIVSLEMSRKDVGLRAVSMESRVDLYKIQTGYLSDAEQQRVGQALERIAAKRLAIDDACGLTDAQLRAKVRRLAVRHGLDLVLIDYMQLLRSSEKAENKNHEVSAMSSGLKSLARDLRIPVVVLSQLNRDNAKTNRRPQLSDLRDSGSLEQDADLVILLHRPGQHDDGQRYGDGEDAEMIIAKHRNGPTGLIKVRWHGEQVRFVELENTERVA